MPSCCVPDCHSSSTGKGRKLKKVKFHRIGRIFDTGTHRADQWIMAIKRYDLLDKPSNYLAKKYVCSLHFEKCMYVSGKLIQTAIPTINLPGKFENFSKATTTTCEAAITTLELDKKEINANEKDMEVQSQETTTGATKIVIKHEPPEPSEMTIEQEQIGYYEKAKRQRVTSSSVKDSVNVLIPQDKSMYVDNRVGNDSTMDDTHKFYEGEVTTNSIKEENFVECVDSHIEKRAKTKNIKSKLPVPSKRNLKKLLQYTIRKPKNIKINKNKKKEACKRFLLGYDIYLTPQLSSIVKKHLNSKGDEFTDEYKILCFNLYMSSPTTYKFLSQVLCLPCKKDLIKSYFPIDSKINEEMLSILSTVAHKMSSLDKECVLTLGEIKLKRSIFYDAKADRLFGLHEINGEQNVCAGGYAYTVMLRGVATDWKLLIGFSFTLLNKLNAGLNYWLQNTLAQLFQMGFKVRAVCSPLSTHLLNIKDLLENKCYLELDGKKIYFIFDIRRILIKARNALRAGILVMKDRKASWTCVKQLYAVDHKNVETLAPQLTKVHIKPKKHNLNKLRYASEVLDSSVAMALNIYAEKKDLKPYFGTIQFIHTMSRVFKALNCDKPITCSNEEKQLFDQTRGMLNSIVFKNTKHNLNHQFKDALSITLNSISLLGDDMQSDNIVIRRSKLTNSCMKSFYDAIRQLSGHSRRVTCREYLRAFRRCFLFHALRMAEKKDTSLTNNAAFLAEYEDYVRTNKIYQTRKRKLSKDLLPVYLSTSEENRFISICSYMLQKCVEKHACPKLIEYVGSSVVAQESEIAGICVPPEHFLIYCRNFENYLQFSFAHSIGENIFINLKKKVKRLYFDKPCKCFPVDFLLGMFVKIRIKLNNMLNNMKWKQDSSTSNTFEFFRM